VASKLATLIACKINKFYVMKNLDLNAMGVVEMDANEIKETDGGILPLIIIAGLLILTGCSGSEEEEKGGSGGATNYNTTRSNRSNG
jgi:lactobin A/cerein 7B family class IIb bacteriocin